MFAEKLFKLIYGMPKKSAAGIGEYAFRRECGNCRRQNKESAAAGASLSAPPIDSPENIFSPRAFRIYPAAPPAELFFSATSKRHPSLNLFHHKFSQRSCKMKRLALFIAQNLAGYRYAEYQSQNKQQKLRAPRLHAAKKYNMNEGNRSHIKVETFSHGIIDNKAGKNRRRNGRDCRNRKNYCEQCAKVTVLIRNSKHGTKIFKAHYDVYNKCNCVNHRSGF